MICIRALRSCGIDVRDERSVEPVGRLVIVKERGEG
jgi:hypothetical protein